MKKEYNLKGILIRAITFKYNVENGKATYYDEDGSGEIMIQGAFQNDTMRGDWKISYDAKWNKNFHKSTATYYGLENISPDGSMKATDFYITGEKEGELVFDKDRLLTGTYYYKDGKIMKKETWNPATGKYDTIEYNEDGSAKQ